MIAAERRIASLRVQRQFRTVRLTPHSICVLTPLRLLDWLAQDGPPLGRLDPPRVTEVDLVVLARHT